jgi:enoyl-CoA hydratase/carnithine racemase
VDEREREVEPALHAARVAADLARRRVGQADALEQLVAAGAPVGGGQAVQAGLQVEVLAPGEEVVERRLLQRGADAPPDLRPCRATSTRRRSPGPRSAAAAS